ncbi:MAG TPA: 3-phosphoshikimate 1-carboxyvinyltransferase [Acidimicrobiia bacterium]
MSVPTDLTLAGPRPLRGRLRVPGDKGISHRALLLAALADGRSRLTGLADGDDVHRTRLALEHLGVRVRTSGGAVVVTGTAGRLREPEVVLDCGNSATTMRMVAGLVAAQPFHSVLSGDASLRARPMARVAEPLRRLGARIDGRDGGDRSPLAIRGGALHGARCDLAVASGQVKTAVALAGLQADGTTEIVEPRRSRDHTERLLKALGAPIEVVDDRTLRVRRASLPAFELDVPGDPSSAAFFTVAASVTAGSAIVLEGVSINPSRIGFVDVLHRMGARIEVRPTGERLGEPVGDIEVEAAPLTGTTFSPDEGWIDEVPALAVAAAFAEGVTEIRDAAELRVKESDRIGTLAQELSQLGVDIEARPDGLTIRGGRPQAALLKSHGDHRVAMAAAVAAVACAGATTVRGWRAVAASYPGFADDLASLTESSP